MKPLVIPLGPSKLPAPRTQRMRVLVADDELLVRGVIGRVLRRADLEVVEVDSADSAIRALEAGAFDVIVTDVYMPGGGGLELLRAVRRLDLDVPVILLSGTPDVPSASAAVEYGAFRYLTKPVDNEVLTELVRTADRAHALARLRRAAFSISGAHAGVADRAGLEVRFGRALEAMWMAFQPIVVARTGALYGVEALLRSSEPSMPDPQSILDAATELGMLDLLGRRIRALCAASASALADGITMFVNLHPEDLDDPDLLVDDAPLTRVAARIVLEVTERSTLKSTPALTQRLARLRGLGYRLAVDDIGAGYSGLTSFTELMPEVVKIDLALVRDVHTSAVKQRTIAALSNLCHEVGCVVVAEGVETEDERRCLLELGCDLFQGYLFGRPVRELPHAAVPGERATIVA